MSKSSNDSDGNSDLTDGNGTKDPDMKKKKNMSTKQKMKDALSKKQQESMSKSTNPFGSEQVNKSSKKLKQSDPTVVLDMSDEDPNEGSQR